MLPNEKLDNEKRLTANDLRKLDKDFEKITDKEVEEILDNIYQLAEIVCVHYLKEQNIKHEPIRKNI